MGLTAYRTLSGRKSVPAFTPVQDRPSGEVIWIHAGEAGNTRAISDLAQRIVGARDGVHVVLTAVDQMTREDEMPGVVLEQLPSDHPEHADRFIAHWQPDVVIWCWGGLRPNLVLAAAASGARMMLVDAARDGFDRRRDRWLPEVPRRLLDNFDIFLARSQPAQARLVQLGRDYAEIEVTTPLRPFGHTLPAADTDIADLGAALVGRPVWAGAMTRIDEIQTLLGAHKHALKSSHRLLLVLHLANHRDTGEALAQLRRHNLRHAAWSDGEMPDDNTQVLLADAADELGLWLRIAAVSFLGGTLSTRHVGLDPYAVAVHGSAILHGPEVGEHADALVRLRAAGAAVLATEANSLGQAVIRTSAPDVAARMAMAGWDVTTAAARSLDRIVSLVQTSLDARQEVPV